MTQQPDHLFREKLQNIQLAAPRDAWSKIETGLNKSSHKDLWLKIAAGLALLVTASVWIWNSSGETVTPVAIVKETEAELQATLHDQSPTKSESAVRTNEVVDPAPIIHQRSRNRNVQPAVAAVEISAMPVVEETEISESNVEIASPLQEEVIAEPGAQHTAKYIVYTAEEVNAKYLRKMPEEEATSAEKKSSRMQMLAGIAHNLKNGDNGFGELRQMKDEIFALNFLDSKKEQSKRN